MKQPSLNEKIRYYFENTMSSGPIGIIKWLALASLFMVLTLGFVILIFKIKGTPYPNAEELGFIEGVWQSLMATLDSGTMGGDEGWSFRLVRFIATLGGIFVISILIGTISSGIDEKIEELKKGRSRVLEKNHTLILGWNDKIYYIISEIIEANKNQKKSCIVILADKDKVEIEDDLRGRFDNFKNTKIVVRNGNPLDLADIEIVSPNEARSIIVLASEINNADTYVIKSVLALTNGRNRKKDSFNIVAEIKDIKNMAAAELVGNNEAVFLLSQDIISRITAQTCRQSGLSLVYNELLRFEGDEIYFHSEPKLEGKTFKEVIFSYASSSVIGIYTKDGIAKINPSMDSKFCIGDSVIAISEDDDTVILSDANKIDVQFNTIYHENKNKIEIENTLILGWNEKGSRIIEELDNYVASGSRVFVVSDNFDLPNQISKVRELINKQTIDCFVGNINDRNTLIELSPESFNYIILLSSTNLEIQESDAKTLICLLHLRELGQKVGKNFNIVSEMLDIRNHELGRVARADDFIVSDNLIALMISQLSENKNLKKVYDILFESEGSEIYLKTVSNYINTNDAVNFYTILESASQLNETAIGYRLISQSANPDFNYGIYINPLKSNMIKFEPGDSIIVLAEEN
jgi:voltage-gated potassium channel Kch